MKHRYALVFMAVLLGAGVLQAHASNNLFLREDAYFSSAFTEDFAEGAISGDVLTLDYRRYVGVFMACGYTGFDDFEIRDLPDSYRENFKKVQEIIFKEFGDQSDSWKAVWKNEKGKIEGTQMRYFPMFVYNKSFDIHNLPVAVRFNPSWPVETPDDIISNSPNPEVEYQGIMDPRLIAKDWQMAKVTEPLKITKYPKWTPSPDGHGVKYDGPLVANAKDLQFVILAGTEVEDFARQKPGLTIFVVSDTVERFEYGGLLEGVTKVALDAKPNGYEAKAATARKDLQLLSGALEIYHANTGSYPTEDQGLGALVTRPKDVAEEKWMQVLRMIPKQDPWGKPYFYPGDGDVSCEGPYGDIDFDG